MEKHALAAIALGLILTGTHTVNATDQYSLSDRASYAGFYLQVPFGKSDQTGHKQTKFGFQAGWRQDFSRRYQRRATSSYQAKLIDLSFNSTGFDRLSLAGNPIVYQADNGLALGLNADDSGTEDGSNVWPWIFGIVAVGGLTAIVISEKYDDCVHVPTVTVCVD